MGNIEYISSARGGGGPSGAVAADDTTSLGSFNSDTNNNPSVYHNLVSAMAATKVGGGGGYQHGDDDDDEDSANNNPAPPPLRPKSSASQHAPEKSWYETSLDKVASGSSKATTKHGHKPPALLPREMANPTPQLHIEIPTSPHHLHPHQHPQLERSMSHRIVGAGNFSTSSSPPPPITRQQEALLSPGGSHQQHHKKLYSSATSGGGVAGGANNGNAVRRNQSNVPIMAGQASPALLSPRLVNNNAAEGAGSGAPLSPSMVAKVAAEEEIQVESPKNVTVVQQGKFLPYKEESKPFEMSDFYKYSTKFRQPTGAGATAGTMGGGNSSSGSGRRAVSRNGNAEGENPTYRGNALYQQEQQRGVYADLADVANNNRGGGAGAGGSGSSNNHNNSNGHILQHPKSSNGSMYGQQQGVGASNATTGGSGSGGGPYPISYQQ